MRRGVRRHAIPVGFVKEFSHVNSFGPKVVVLDGLNIFLPDAYLETFKVVMSLRNQFRINEFDAFVFRPCFDVVGGAFDIGIC